MHSAVSERRCSTYPVQFWWICFIRNRLISMRSSKVKREPSNYKIKRIRGEMQKIIEEVGFKGSFDDFLLPEIFDWDRLTDTVKVLFVCLDVVRRNDVDSQKGSFSLGRVGGLLGETDKNCFDGESGCSLLTFSKNFLNLFLRVYFNEWFLVAPI